MMEKVYFKPWVGCDYGKGDGANKKLMILGDSHYCGEPCIEKCGETCCIKPDFTTRVVNDFVTSAITRYTERYMNTFAQFERAVMNKELSQGERKDFWNSVVFYNYLQRALLAPGVVPNPKLYDEAFIAFTSIIEEYQPDFIIVWGMRLFRNYLPQHNGKEGEIIQVDEISYAETWSYFLSTGKEVRLLGVYHPSRAFKREYWHKIIHKFLNRNI